MSSCITAEHRSTVNKGEGTQVNNYGCISRGGGNSIDRRRSGGSSNRTLRACPALRCLKLEEAGGRHRRRQSLSGQARRRGKSRADAGEQGCESCGEEASARAPSAIGEQGIQISVVGRW
jgi:hypothetical protein